MGSRDRSLPRANRLWLLPRMLTTPKRNGVRGVADAHLSSQLWELAIGRWRLKDR
jgi:hypothetical protein